MDCSLRLVIAEEAAAKRLSQTMNDLARLSPKRHAGKDLPQDSACKDGHYKIAVMQSTNNSYKIASIPGDGIGPEVISAAITVLQRLASTLRTFSVQCEHLPWSSDYYKAHGRYIPEGGLEQLRNYDAILFGSVGDPGMPLLKMHLSPSQY